MIVRQKIILYREIEIDPAELKQANFNFFDSAGYYEINESKKATIGQRFLEWLTEGIEINF